MCFKHFLLFSFFFLNTIAIIRPEMDSTLVAHPPNPETIEYVDQDRFREVQTVVYVRAVQLNRLPDVVQYSEGGVAVTITSGESSYTLTPLVPGDETEITDRVTGERTPRGTCQTFTMLWDDVSLMFPGTPYKGDGPTYLPFPFEYADGLHISVHSADGTRDFGTALVKGSEENTLLSYPRGDVQVLFRVYHCCDGEIVYTRRCERRKRTPPPGDAPPEEEEVEEEEDDEEEYDQEVTRDNTGGEQSTGDDNADAIAAALRRIQVAEDKAKEAQRNAAAAEEEAAEAQRRADQLEDEHAGAEHRSKAHTEAARAWRAAAAAEKKAAGAEGDLAEAYDHAFHLCGQEDFPDRERAARERQDLALKRMQDALDRAASEDDKANNAEKELNDLFQAAGDAERDASESQKKSDELQDAAIQKRDADPDSDDTHKALSDAADELMKAAKKEREAAAAERELAKNQVDGSDSEAAAAAADRRAEEAEKRANDIRPPKKEPVKEEPATKEPTKPKKGLGDDEEGGGCLC